MDKHLLDLYTDYLVASFGSTTATGLARLLDQAVSHDQITRFLSKRQFTSADLWLVVKPIVRQVQHPDGLLIIDDSIEEKPYTDESELDRKSTRLNSSHANISYAVFCLKKKKKYST